MVLTTCFCVHVHTVYHKTLIELKKKNNKHLSFLYGLKFAASLSLFIFLCSGAFHSSLKKQKKPKKKQIWFECSFFLWAQAFRQLYTPGYTVPSWHFRLHLLAFSTSFHASALISGPHYCPNLSAKAHSDCYHVMLCEGCWDASYLWRWTGKASGKGKQLKEERKVARKWYEELRPHDSVDRRRG